MSISRPDVEKERTNEAKDRSIQTSQTKMQRETNKNKKKNIRGLWNNFKRRTE